MGELFQFIFRLEDATGRSIVWAICICFAIGVFNYLLQIAWVGWEWLNLKRIQDYWTRNHGLGDVSQKTALLERLDEAKVWPRSIIYRRIEALLQVRDSGGHIDNDALADIRIGKESQRASLANHILGILIILGLVGTLWGLITALIQVRPIVTGVQDFEELAEISKTLELTVGGMSTAFATTLAGLLTSLVLGLIGLGFNRAQSFFLTTLEEFVSTAILPRFTQTPEASIESAVQKLAECTNMLKFATDENVAAMRRAIQQLTDTSWGGHLEQQQILAFKFDETSENLLKSLGGINEYQLLITAAVDSFKDMTAKTMGEITGYQDALHQGLEESVPRLEEESAALQKAIRAYRDSQATFIDELSSALQTEIRAITGQQQDMVQTLMQLVTEEREASQAAMRESQDAQAEFLKHLSDALLAEMHAITGQQQNVVHVLTQFTDNLMQLLTEEREASQAAMRESQDAQAEFLQNLSDALLSDMRNITGQQQNVAHVLTQLADELKIRSAIEEQNQAFERIEAQLDTNGQQLGQGFQSIADYQQEMLQVLQQLLGELQIGSAFEEQNQLLRRIADELQIGSALDLQNQTFGRIANELQIRPTLETQTRVLQGIESHLAESRSLNEEQDQRIRALVESVKQLLQRRVPGPGGSQPPADLQEVTDLLQQIYLKLDKLPPEVTNLLQQILLKLDELNKTLHQPGIFRWVSAFHRWLRGEK